MALKNNRVIVVDLECTCWAEAGWQSEMEIIEIGICVLNAWTGAIERVKSRIVRPQTSMISSFCEGLTGLSQRNVDHDGIPLGGALNQLQKEYPFQSCAWGSWGNFDKAQIVRECGDKNLFYPLNWTHLNIKHLYSFLQHRKGVSVEKALKQLGLKFVGRPHSGVDDAFNIARILRNLCGWNEDSEGNPYRGDSNGNCRLCG